MRIPISISCAFLSMATACLDVLSWILLFEHHPCDTRSEQTQHEHSNTAYVTHHVCGAKEAQHEHSNTRVCYICDKAGETIPGVCKYIYIYIYIYVCVSVHVVIREWRREAVEQCRARKRKAKH